MAYQVDANGVIIRDGVMIEKDVTSVDYQQFLYFQQYGVDVSCQPVIVPEVVEEKQEE